MAEKLTRDELTDALEQALSGEGTKALQEVVKRTNTDRFFRDGDRLQIEQEDGTRLQVQTFGSNAT